MLHAGATGAGSVAGERRTMHKRTLVIIGLGLLIGLGIGGFLYVRSVLSFEPLPTYSTTVIAGKPAGASCQNKTRSAELAIELLNLQDDIIYLAGGDNPISEAQWDATSVRFPYMKNSKRYLLFNDTCFYRSPGKPADCQGDECMTFTEIYDHSWFEMVHVAGQGCYPDASGCAGDEVKPGYVSLTTIDKCQELTFAGPVLYELRDEQGNRYIMHATADDQPTTDVALPSGWTLHEMARRAPLTIQPRGAGHCYYNIVRDANVQSYHQYIFADETFNPERFQ